MNFSNRVFPGLHDMLASSLEKNFSVFDCSASAKLRASDCAVDGIFFPKGRHPICLVSNVSSTQARGDLFMNELFRRFVKEEQGQDLVEYALLLVFIALAAIAVLPTLGQAVNNVFSSSASTLVTGS